MTNDFPPTFGGVQQYVYNLVANLPADRITVLAPAADGASRFGDAQRFGVVRDRLSTLRPSYCVARGSPDPAPSRLVPRKGHDVPLRAMPFLIDAIDASLEIVGEGPYEQRLRRLASALPPERVAFVVAVPDDLLPGYHAASDVVAIPCRSRYLGVGVEGLGIVYLEAAASGKPALAGRSGGTDEAVIDGVTGLLVDGSSVDEVVDSTVQRARHLRTERTGFGGGVG